jgi:hypothetical protein
LPTQRRPRREAIVASLVAQEAQETLLPNQQKNRAPQKFLPGRIP